MPERILVEADERGRVSLARLGGAGRQYLATVHKTGTITLEPAVVLTEREAEELARARERATTGKTVPLADALRRIRDD
jgi:hypothetical protein